MLSSDFLPARSHRILRITFCLSPSPSLRWVALLDLLSQAWGSMDGCPCSHGCFSSPWYGCSHSLVHSRASQLLSLPSHCAPRGCLPHLGSCSLALCYCLNIQRQASVKASVKCQEHKEKVGGISVHSNMKPEKAWRYVRMPVPRLETTSIYRRRKNFNFKRKKCIPGVGIFQSVHWWFFTSWHFCQMYKQYCWQIIEISSPIAHPSSAPQLLFCPRCLWVCNAKQLELLLLHQVLFWSQCPPMPWRRSPLTPSSWMVSISVQGRVHFPLLAMCSLGPALGSHVPMPVGWGLSQPSTRNGVKRACYTARRLDFAVISYENKPKLNRLFAGRKTSPCWGLLSLESQWLNSQMFLAPRALGAFMAQELVVPLAKHQDFPGIWENVYFLLRWKITGIALQLWSFGYYIVPSGRWSRATLWPMGHRCWENSPPGQSGKFSIKMRRFHWLTRVQCDPCWVSFT